MFERQTPLLVAINIILFLVLLLLTRPSLTSGTLPRFKRRLVYFLLLLFCIFSFWGADWFHYLDLFRLLKNNPYDNTHLEPFYVWVINNIAPTYFVFRFIIWGGALFLFWLTLHTLSMDKGEALFFFVVGFLIWFSYSRATLAMSMMFLGTALITQESKSYRFSRLLFGLVGLVLAFFLHKSAILGLAIIAMAFSLSVVKTKTYRVIILLVPLFIVGMRYLFVNIGDFVSGDEYLEFVADSASRNFSAESSSMGIGSLLQTILEKIPYFLTALCGIMIQKHRHNIPRSINCFASILILLVVISTVLLFVDNYNTKTLSIRLFRFSIIPATILLSFCWKNRLNMKLVKTTMWLCVVSSSYQLLYAFYVL